MSNELRFTQNFLRSRTLVEKIVTQAGIRAGDTVLEIGPGEGIITAALAQKVTSQGRVVAIELDSRLVGKLRDRFSNTPQIEIINADILAFPLEKLPQEYAVFSNIPFNITSTLLETLFSLKNSPSSAFLILQTEAIIETNKHGIQTETFKSLMIKPFYEISVAHTFSKSDFMPQPGVDTALFAFNRRQTPLMDSAHYDLYKDFLAFVSKDRVGEGVWLKLFSKSQLLKLAGQTALVYGRGIKSQSIEAIMAAFQAFRSGNPSKHALVQGAMANLRDEQKRREQINRAGGHHRSKKKPDRRR